MGEVLTSRTVKDESRGKPGLCLDPSARMIGRYLPVTKTHVSTNAGTHV